jgi:hypothetical protein
MPLFLEPSAWVKLYVEEEGSAEMRRLMARPELKDEFFASAAVALEMYGRMAKGLRVDLARVGGYLASTTDRTTRRKLGKGIRAGIRRKHREAMVQFDLDYRDGINLVKLEEEVFQKALWIAPQAQERSVSPMDILHLSTALHLSEHLRVEGLPYNVVLITADGNLQSVAIARGTDVWDPMFDRAEDIHSPRLGI